MTPRHDNWSQPEKTMKKEKWKNPYWDDEAEKAQNRANARLRRLLKQGQSTAQSKPQPSEQQIETTMRMLNCDRSKAVQILSMF